MINIVKIETQDRIGVAYGTVQQLARVPHVLQSTVLARQASNGNYGDNHSS